MPPVCRAAFYDATTLNVDGVDRTVRMRTLFTTADYLEALDVPIVAGRNFDPLLASDSTQAALVNQRAISELGMTAETVLGRTVSLPMFDSIPKRIIGVCG